MPQYSGEQIPVKAGDEVAMNSMVLTIVELDGGGNGVGTIKVPMLNGARIALKLSGIQVAKGGCVVGGKAEVGEGVSLLQLDDKLREKLQLASVANQLIANAGQTYAKEIADGVNKTIAAIEDLGKKLNEKKRNTRVLLANYSVNQEETLKQSCTDILKDTYALQDSLEKIIGLIKSGKLKANLAKLQAACAANITFLNKLAPALARCSGLVEPPIRQAAPCNGPCAYEWEVAWVLKACKEEVGESGAFGTAEEKDSKLYDYTKSEIISFSKQDFEFLPIEDTKLHKNLCGEYLPILKLKIDSYAKLDESVVKYQLVPPKNFISFSTCFESEIELFQYVAVRLIQNSCAKDIVSCGGKPYYLDINYIKIQEKIRSILKSDESPNGMDGVAWAIARENLFKRLFEGTPTEQSDAILTINRFESATKLRITNNFIAAMIMPVGPEDILAQKILGYASKVILRGTAKVSDRVGKFFGQKVVNQTGNLLNSSMNDIAKLFNKSNALNSFKIEGKTFTEVAGGNRKTVKIFEGATDAEVKIFAENLAGKPLKVSKDGRAFTAITDEGVTINLRDLSSSKDATGANWTIDIQNSFIVKTSKGKSIDLEIKFK